MGTHTDNDMIYVQHFYEIIKDTVVRYYCMFYTHVQDSLYVTGTFISTNSLQMTFEKHFFVQLGSKLDFKISSCDILHIYTQKCSLND